MRAVLAAVFLIGQSAVALHHHDAEPVSRVAARAGRKAAIHADLDDCALCAYQVLPHVSAPAPVAVAAATFEIVVLPILTAAPPRDLRSGRLSARAPPAV